MMGDPASSSSGTGLIDLYQSSETPPYSSSSGGIQDEASPSAVRGVQQSDETQQPTSEPSYGISMEEERGQTSEEWMLEALAALPRPLQHFWAAIRDLWYEIDDEDCAEAPTTQIIKRLQATALKQKESGAPVPARVWGTLFCTAKCASKGRKVPFKSGKPVFERLPTRLDWAVNAQGRQQISIDEQPFCAIRFLFADSNVVLDAVDRADPEEFRRLVLATKTPYIGVTQQALLERLRELDVRTRRGEPNAPGTLYGPILPIVQSSGAGKSRLLQEMAVFSTGNAAPETIFTLTFRLGDAKTFPRPDEGFRQLINPRRSEGIVIALVIALVAIRGELRDLSPTQRREWVREFAAADSSNRGLVWDIAGAGGEDGDLQSESLAAVLADTKRLLAEGAQDATKLIIAIDEANHLTPNELEALRKRWSPIETMTGIWQWPIERGITLILAGTSRQLGLLAPFPSASGSGRLASGQLHLEHPFTAFSIARPPSLPTQDGDIFAWWHTMGRMLLPTMPVADVGSFVSRMFPSLIQAREVSTLDALGLLKQRVAFDILGSGAVAGTFATMSTVRALEAEQVNDRLSWCLRASCRNQELRTTTVAEPAIAYHLSEILARDSTGWARVLRTFHTLLFSIEGLVIESGPLGELLCQIILVIAIDRLRFLDATMALDTAERRLRVVLPLDAFLKMVTRRSVHANLDSLLQPDGAVSFVHFRQHRTHLSSVRQSFLRDLFAKGQAIRAAPRQPHWDLLIPVRFSATAFSYLAIQSKNQVDGRRWTASYESTAPFPELADAPAGTQKLLLYMEVGGSRLSGSQSVSQVAARGSTGAGATAYPEHLFLGNHGQTTSSVQVLAAVFPVLDNGTLASAVKRVTGATEVEPSDTATEALLLAEAEGM